MGAALIGKDKKTIIVEFYGLPGCGKSTLSHQVAKMLRESGKTVAESTYDIDHKYSKLNRKLIKILKMIIYAVRHPINFQYLLRIIKENGYSGCSVISNAANIANKLNIYEKTGIDFVLFDEGITQSAISLSLEGKNKSIDNEQKLYSLCYKREVCKVFLKLSLTKCVKRMSKREKHDSRIEQIKDTKEKMEALRRFNHQCELILADYVIFSGQVEDDAKKLYYDLLNLSN